MLKLVGGDVPSIERFMNQYSASYLICIYTLGLNFGQMDNPAALQRIKVGVPATVEHSSEAGPETGKWVAETTQVGIVSSHVSYFMLKFIFYRASSPLWMH